MDDVLAPPTARSRRGLALAGLGAAAGALVLAGLVAVIRDDGPPPPAPGAARAAVDGEATVVRADGGSERLEDGALVAAGDVVTVESGTVVLELASGALLEGRQGDASVADSSIEVGLVPELLAGDLLIVAANGASVDAGGNVLTLPASSVGDIAARIRRSLTTTVGVYSGSGAIDSAGQRRAVPALRQLSVATLGRPPAAPEPLRYDEADAWDLRFLGEAMDVGRRLEALSRSFTSSITTDQARSPVFFRRVLPTLGRQADFGPALLDTERAPGETLVGAAITALGREGTFAERWSAVFDFRDEGAAWGLVAADQGVSAGPLVGDVEQAITSAATPEIASGPLPGAGGTTPPGTTPNSPGTTSPPGGGATTPPPTSTPTSPPTTPPTPPDGPGDVVPDTGIDLIDDLAEPVDDLLALLLDSLLQP